ncbi:hypothetical protein CEQ07_05145 [Oligella urethralis]|nr:hypothetical protein CEQ07_05145 [Oligella urethralis]
MQIQPTVLVGFLFTALRFYDFGAFLLSDYFNVTATPQHSETLTVTRKHPSTVFNVVRNACELMWLAAV